MIDASRRQTDAFNSSIEEELSRSLSRGVFPVKLAYLGVGASNHDEYAATQGYAQSVGDGAAVGEFARAVLAARGWRRYAIAELGPGAGYATAAALSHLAAQHAAPEAYFCADLSEPLLVMTAQRIAEAGLTIPVGAELCDIETPGGLADFARALDASPAPLLGLLVGLTLGNVEDPAAALANIRHELPMVRDWIISCALRDPALSGDQIVAPYQNATKARNVSQALIDAGIPARSFRIETSFDEAPSAVVSHAVFLEPATVSFGGATYRFEEGQSVRCSLSRRFAPEALEALFSDAGFSIARAGGLEGQSVGCFHVVAGS